MVSGIFQGVNNVVGKVADFVSPKKGQKVGFITDAAAVVATAVAAAAAGPIFAAQLGVAYVLGRYTHNVGEEEQAAQAARAAHAAHAARVKELSSMANDRALVSGK